MIAQFLGEARQDLEVKKEREGNEYDRPNYFHKSDEWKSFCHADSRSSFDPVVRYTFPRAVTDSPS
jgi:hypothetical protein